MSDMPEPLPDDDLSAALDGRADEAVIQRIREDPVSAHRYEALASAREMLSTTPVEPLDAATVDRLVANALDATAPAGAIPGPASATDPVVTPLDAARRRRARGGPPTWAVAAVVAVLVAVGLTLVWSGRDSGDGNRDSALTATTTSAGTKFGGLTTPSVPGSDAPAKLRDLGSFDSNTALRRFLVNTSKPGAEPVDPRTAPSEKAVERCAGQVAILMATVGIGPTPDDTAFAHLSARPVLVYEFTLTKPAGKATRLVSVVDQSTCNPAFTFMR